MITGPYLYALVAAAGFGLGWVVQGWRLDGQIERLEGGLEQSRTQTRIAGEGLKACNAGVDQAKRAGDEARDLSKQLLAAVRSKRAPAEAAIGRIEALLSKTPPPGAGCDAAWAVIEADRRSRGDAGAGKARGTP